MIKKDQADLDAEELLPAINILFDGPPSHNSGRFVEVELDNGHSINAGDWIERPDGLWGLRINYAPRVAAKLREQDAEIEKLREQLRAEAERIWDICACFAIQDRDIHAMIRVAQAKERE